MRVIGLIPARKGSKRIPGKNLAMLGGKPLLQRAIDIAKKSGCFEEVLVSSNWDDCLDVAVANEVMAHRRPDKISQDYSHDYEWVRDALDLFERGSFDIFVILRPTSPFRTAETIQRALQEFMEKQPVDSMRAVEPTRAHPGKSWFLDDHSFPYMRPYYSLILTEMSPTSHIAPYDMPTQRLGRVLCQTACIHVAWTKTLELFNNVSGSHIRPFFTQGDEGVDINTPEDLEFAEWKMRQWAPEDKAAPPYLWGEVA